MIRWKQWWRRKPYQHTLRICTAPLCVVLTDRQIMQGNEVFSKRFSSHTDWHALCDTLGLSSAAIYRLSNALHYAQIHQESVGTYTISIYPIKPTEGFLCIEGRATHHYNASAPKILKNPDISDVQFMQMQKMQAVGQLAGGIAHDFNNLLTSIIGFCDLLLLRHSTTDASYADIVQVRTSAERGASLVQQLLAFARQQTMQPKPMLINDVLRDLESGILRPLLTDGVSFSLDVANDVAYVHFDRTQFEQVIINLAVNARDAMPQGGVLRVQTRLLSPAQIATLTHHTLPKASYVQLLISDTGSGMPPEVQEKIFDPFFTTKDPGKGTGLGLSMVYGIVKQSEGYIFVDSTPTQGTTFAIYLPPCDAPVLTVVPPKNSPQNFRGNFHILFVEDEPAIRAFALRALQSRGHTVYATDDAQEALAVLQTHSIDLLISDVMMPDMNGPTLVAHARALCPHLKVIFISGYAEETMRKSLQYDYDFKFLPKPFSLKQLIETVNNLINDEIAQPTDHP